MRGKSVSCTFQDDNGSFFATVKPNVVYAEYAALITFKNVQLGISAENDMEIKEIGT